MNPNTNIPLAPLPAVSLTNLNDGVGAADDSKAEMTKRMNYLVALGSFKTIVDWTKTKVDDTIFAEFKELLMDDVRWSRFYELLPKKK